MIEAWIISVVVVWILIIYLLLIFFFCPSHHQSSAGSGCRVGSPSSSGTMTQLFGVGEGECAVIFVWAYALASAAVTAWSAFFLWTLRP